MSDADSTDNGADAGAAVPGLGDLLAQAQSLQQQMLEAQQALADQVVEGQAGGGAVKVRCTGELEFQSVTIDPAAVDPADVEMLEDLVLAAIHDATGKARQLANDALGGLGGFGGLLS